MATTDQRDARTELRTGLATLQRLWRRSSELGRGPIGVDVGEHSIAAVQLRRGRQRHALTRGAQAPLLRAEGSAPLDDSAALVEQLTELLRGHRFGGRQLVLSVPPSLPRIVSLTFKPSSRLDIPRQASELALERLGGSRGDWLFDYLETELGNRQLNEVNLMLAALPRAPVMGLIEAIARAGFYLRAVEIRAQGLQRLAHFQGGPRANVMVLNVGRHSSTLTQIVNGRLTLDRQISVGRADFLAPLADELALGPRVSADLLGLIGLRPDTALPSLMQTPFSQLGQQIELMRHQIRANFHGGGFDTLYLCGEAQRWPGASEAIGAALGCPCELLQPFAHMLVDTALSGARAHRPRLLLATGMALHGGGQ